MKKGLYSDIGKILCFTLLYPKREVIPLDRGTIYKQQNI